MLSPCCYTGFFVSSCGEQELLSRCMLVSHYGGFVAVEHRLQGTQASVVGSGIVAL